MKLIQNLSENIEEEIEGVKNYAKMAIEVRSEYPLVADTLYTISRQEAEHVNKLHEAVTNVIKDYRQKNGEPPADMLAVYNYLHKQQIEKMADARRYLDMYQGK